MSDNTNDFLDHEGNQPHTPDESAHYYGDLVRKLFMAAAVIMLIGLPFFHDYIPVPVNYSVLGIILLGIFAGLVNPKLYLVTLLNTMIATVALIAFEFYAIKSFTQQQSFFFVINELLAIIFLFALYYSTKTLRGTMSK